MSNYPNFTRRAALASTAAFAATPVLAKAPFGGPLEPSLRRFMLGDFEVTVISDGSAMRDSLHPMFGANTDASEVSALALENNLPASNVQFYFHPTIVNTGNEVILFDTGNGAGALPQRGQLAANMAASGISPADVDVVVLTHMHPDHIGGLMENGAATFPNARYVTGTKEYNFWSDPARMSGPTERIAKMVAGNVTPFAEKMTFLEPGGSVVSGVEAVSAFGHTPGHMTYHIESAGKRLMITADTANHYVLSLQRPDWHFGFDADKAGAVKSRRDVFGMIAADKIPFVGYHMPSPGVGYVAQSGDGFEYEAASYQLNL